MSKCIFLDRDGTINADTHYLHRIKDFSFLPGAVEGMSLLRQAGYILIIITNQSGIARGIFTEEEYLSLNSWMLSELKKLGIDIAATYYCPHHPEVAVEKYRAACDCRKPGLGLFKRAMADFSIDASSSWAVGDRMRDVAVCGSFPVRGVVLYNGSSAREGNIWRIEGGLKEAAEKIVRNGFI